MIEHPAAFRTPGSNQPVTIPVFLTKEERKKLRRRKRLERERVYNVN
jgi:pre-mRNA processing factor 3 (PRP3).